MNWYTKSEEDVLKELQSSEQGLSKIESEKRLKQYGKNELPHKKQLGVFTIMLHQLKDPILILLVVATVFSFLAQEVIDGMAILFIIFIDLIMGTIQEWKALKNVQALANMIAVKTKVIRAGSEFEIDAKQVVIGDLVVLESGSKIVADMRIIECSNLTVDESVLTGESLPASKRTGTLRGEIPIADQNNMVFAGTSVMTGRAKGIVVKTALETEIGKIAHKVSNTEETKSPLTIRMGKFSKQISILVVIIAIIITILLWMKNTPLTAIFLSVIALSVSAMPEGLPLALTMALTIASNRMSKKKVIVKKLNAVESLGSCTLIASDKTGTLTVNEQTAKKIILPSNISFEIEGTGYYNLGQVTSQNGQIEDAHHIAKLGVLNNEATLKDHTHFGDSIDVAFLTLGKKLKVDTQKVHTVSRLPYESENQYSAVFYVEQQKYYGTVKGSFEKVISFCSKMRGVELVPIDYDMLQQQNEALARQGYRVIALASKEISKNHYEEKDLHDFTFEGMVAFIDPIREEAKTAILDCKKAGIDVVMITGDHPLTAFSIAKELSLVTTYDEVATGKEVAASFEKGKPIFDAFVRQKKVFTRVTPIDKLEIVESYKRQGEFVAVTGDGVNDAPALKAANIGVSMGSGTDVAKETADMIVIDDNFASIVAGVKEGRNAYSNIRKVSEMLLSCGMAEVLFFLLSIAFNLPMPLVAIQLLWLNLVTDGLQDFALSFEKAEKGIMKELPRNPKESIFNKELLIEVLLAGMTIGVSVFLVWVYLIKYLQMDPSVARGYIMILMVFMQNMHVLNCRSEKRSIWKVPLKGNPLILFSIISAIILQIIVSEIPLFSQFLKTSSVPFIHMIPLFIISIGIIGVMELYKKIRY